MPGDGPSPLPNEIFFIRPVGTNLGEVTGRQLRLEEHEEFK